MASSSKEAAVGGKTIKIYGNSKLSERVNTFKEKAEKHSEKQQSNPFSGQFAQGHKTQTQLDRNDPNYGRPQAGSKSDRRGKQAAAHIGGEVQELCKIIKEFGEEQEDGTFEITFKEIFDIYQVISNKVVGVLLRARKHGLVEFEGEMLYQRRDDRVIITLLVDPDTIERNQDSTSCVKTTTTTMTA